MSLPYRVRISFGVLLATPILWTISLSGPSLGQARAESGAQSGQPRAPAAHHRPHMKGTFIVCETADVHSCHKEFARRHRAQAH
jgi:hypothetical protein